VASALGILDGVNENAEVAVKWPLGVSLCATRLSLSERSPPRPRST
jgi:hypothetical protein